MLTPFSFFTFYFKIMFGLGWPEIVIIAVVVVLIFGQKKNTRIWGSFGENFTGI